MTQYQISNGKETLIFNSEKETYEYLGVKRCSVASCFRRGSKCKGYEIKRLGNTFHMETNTRLHKIWASMIERCEYNKHPYYANYGGRGITVCDEWHKYIAFRDWAIEHNYSNNLTIDRIDNEKGYEPDNCRWITMQEQQNNKRSNHFIWLNGVRHTISEWAKITGIKKSTIRERLKRGWSDEDALTVLVRKRTKGYRPSTPCNTRMDKEDEHEAD